MRLIVNFGNKEITALNKDEKKYLPSDRLSFFNKVRGLAEALNACNIDDIDKDGNLLNPLNILDVDGKQHLIAKVEFPILAAEVDTALKYSKEEQLYVTAFVTRQTKGGEPWQDTFVIPEILLGNYGKKVFPNVLFEFEEINCNPSDYSEVHKEYSDWFSSRQFDGEVIVAIASGTPAMINALATCSIRYCKKVKQFYSSREENDKTYVYDLKFFTENEFSIAKERFKTTFEGGDYASAKILISQPPLSYIPGVDSFVEYFDCRRNYRFKEAKEKYKQCISCNESVYPLEACSVNLEKMQSFIDSIGKNNCDYSKDGAIFTLYESLLNAEFFYEKEQYFTAVAFFNAFLDMITNYLIGKAVGCSMKYDFNKEWYLGLDECIERIDSNCLAQLFSDENSKNRGSKAKKNKLLQWLSDRTEDQIGINPKVIKDFCHVYNRQGEFIDFGRLRNSLPIAHNPKGISREEIEKTLRIDDDTNPQINSDNKFIGVVHVLKNILINSDPNNWEELFEDYRSIGVEIIDSFALDF